MHSILIMNYAETKLVRDRLENKSILFDETNHLLDNLRQREEREERERAS